MKSILFLAGKYFPKSSANGVCCKNIAEECVRQGFNVTCVINTDVTRPKLENINGVTCHRITPRLNYRIQDWCEYNPNNPWVPILKRISIGINKLQLFFMAAFWPLVSPLYTYRFYKKGVKLMQQQHFDMVISVYTPIDSLLAGYYLKKRFPQAKYITYYLDALAGGWGPKYWDKSKIDKRTRKWETKIDNKADLIVSMLSAENYHTNNPLHLTNNCRRVYLDVPTFVPAVFITTMNSVSENSTVPTILYVGSIRYPDRNPLPILNAFIEVLKTTSLNILFAGPINCIDIFNEYSKKSNGQIKYIGELSHEQALEKISMVDFVLNLGNSNPNTVPSKIFEYINLRKPIIATLPISNEPCIPYLKKYSTAFLFDENPQNFNTEVARLKDFILSKPKVADIDYSKIYYLNTPQAFVDLIKQL